MNPTNQRIIAAIILVGIVVPAAIYSWRKARSGAVPSDVATLSTTTLDQINTDDLLRSGDQQTADGAVTVSGQGDYKIETIALPPNTSAPDFRAPVSCTFSAEVCAEIAKKVSAAVAALEKNDADLGAWINLGTLRKIAGDHKGAAQAWEFVSSVYPTNPLSFSNLGDLYKNYLHDNAKAEQNYLTAIKNYPENIDAYRALAEMYAAGYRGGSSAQDVLQKGIQANPSAVDLHVLLARYYVSTGKTAEAAASYDAAIALAKKQNNTTLAAALTAEKAGK